MLERDKETRMRNVVTRGKRGREEVVRGKRGPMYSDGRTWVNTQCNVQMMSSRTVYLKPF